MLVLVKEPGSRYNKAADCGSENSAKNYGEQHPAIFCWRGRLLFVIAINQERF
jgi:hypothetical protein